MTRETTPPLNHPLLIPGNAFSKFEAVDLLCLLYLLALIRPCFWSLHNQFLSWTLTAIVGALLWYGYVVTKPFPRVKFGKSFWLVVGVPLLFAFLLRAAFPDYSFDVLTYHVLHGERTLRGPLFQANDFFHSVPFNPAPDTITAISRWVFGYRLGTAVNLLVLIWTAQIGDRILRSYLSNAWIRAASVLLVVLTENVMFEISTYMVDLLMLPPLLQATFLTLRIDEAENRQLNFMHIGLMLGIAAALKLTTLAVGLPLLAICVYKIVSRLSSREILRPTLLLFVSFLMPLVPFTVYVYGITGNPIFPVANRFFQSGYWPTTGGWDGRWGPQSTLEGLVWPVLAWFKPERHSELAVYAGRLSLGFLTALVGLVLQWRRTQVRILCLILLSTALLWSQTAMGYSRYGLFEDLVAGITIVVVATTLLPQTSLRQLNWKTAVGSLLVVVFVVQSCLGFLYALNRDWGGRTTLLKSPGSFMREAGWMFRDRHLKQFLPETERAKIEKARLWVEATQKASAFEVLLNPDLPVVALHHDEFFASRNSWQEFIAKVKQTNGDGMYALCIAEDLSKARQALEYRGLEIAQVESFEMHFFSTSDRIGMMLIEVQIPQDPVARERFESLWMKVAFPSSDYREEIVALNLPSTLRVNQRVEVRFKVKNLGGATWPSVGNRDSVYQVHLGDRWMKDGKIIEDARGQLKADLPPGQETEITMVIKAPDIPGNYTLQLDMVHEAVTWFRENGAEPLFVPIVVTP
jgi:hypothetical protein